MCLKVTNFVKCNNHEGNKVISFILQGGKSNQSKQFLVLSQILQHQFGANKKSVE